MAAAVAEGAWWSCYLGNAETNEQVEVIEYRDLSAGTMREAFVRALPEFGVFLGEPVRRERSERRKPIGGISRRASCHGEPPFQGCLDQAAEAATGCDENGPSAMWVLLDYLLSSYRRWVSRTGRRNEQTARERRSLFTQSSHVHRPALAVLRPPRNRTGRLTEPASVIAMN
jgi:hypothetical protein